MDTAAVLSLLVRANTTQANAALTATQGNLRRTAAVAESSAAATAASWNKAGKRVSSIGKTLTTHVSLPAAAAGAASVKLAFDFNESMERIHNLAGTSTETVERFKKAVLDLAPAVGKSPQELADALYFIRSSGIKAADSMDVLRASAKASAIGLGETETVADATTSAMNAYRRSGLTAAQATNVLAQAVQKGKGEPADLAKSIGRVIPVASQLNVPFHDVGASLAGLTLQGLNAAEATTALRGVFLALLKPTQDGNEALAKVGLTTDQLRNVLETKGTLAMLQLLATRFRGNEEAMAKVFPNVRALVGAFNLTGDSAKRNAQIFREMSGSTDTVGKGFRDLADTDAFKMRQALAQLQVTGVKLGQQLLPVAVRLAKGFSVLFGVLGKIPGAMEILLGLIVVGPFIRLVGVIMQIRGAMLAYRAATVGAAAAQAGLNAELGASAFTGAAGRWALLATRIGAIAAPAAIAAVGIHQLIKTSGDDIVRLNAKVGLSQSAIEQYINRVKASEKGLTAFRAAQIQNRVIQLAREGKVSEQWAAGVIRDMRNAITGSEKWAHFMNQMMSLADNNFAHMGKSIRFQMGKISDAIRSGKDPMQALKAAVDAMVVGIDKAMDKGKVSVNAGIRQINAWVDQSRRLAGLAPIPGGFITPPADVQAAGHHGGHRQRGGVMTVAGWGTGDKVRAMLEPGEVVLNRTLVRKMGGPKAANSLNALVPRFQKGGILDVRGQYAGGWPNAPQDDVAAVGLNNALKAAKDSTQSAISKFGAMDGGGAGSLGGVKIASWIIPILRWAMRHGWHGTVTSGYRTPAQQMAAATAYGLSHYGPGGPLASNHVRLAYPGGAVDVTNPAQLAAVLRGYHGAHRLVWGGPVIGDYVHFSATGHQQGGIVGDFAKAGVSTHATKKAMYALFEAGLAESGMRDLAGGDSTSEGVLQVLSSTARSHGVNPHNEFGVAKEFLTRGFWTHGGAINLSRRIDSAALIAHLVQGNATGTGVYSAQAGRAQDLLRGSGLRFPGNVAHMGPLQKVKPKGGKKTGQGAEPAPEDTWVPVLPNSIQGAITSLSGEDGLIARAESFASRASEFSTDQGKVLVGGKDELGWIFQELVWMSDLRNAYIAAMNHFLLVAAKYMEAIEQARQGVALAKQAMQEIREVLAGKRNRFSAILSGPYVPKWLRWFRPLPQGKLNQKQIAKLRGDWPDIKSEMQGGIKEHQAKIARWRGRHDKTLAALNSEDGVMVGLSDLQEPVADAALRYVPGLNLADKKYWGVFGGNIASAQSALKSAMEAGIDTSGVDTSHADAVAALARQLADEANARALVSEIALQTLGGAFAGGFAKGGILGAGQWGVAGEHGPEAVVGPAAVLPGGMHADIYIGGQKIEEMVAVRFRTASERARSRERRSLA